MPVLMRDRLQRSLGVVRTPSRILRTVLLFVVLATLVLIAAMYGRDTDLAHVKVTFLSGSEQGNYYAVVNKLGQEAKRQRGSIRNVSTAGSIENITRLAAARASCDIHFALVQDGLPWPEGNTFELIGRLPAPESFVVLGRNADRIKTISDLRGLRLGIGPPGSGTAHVARQLLAQLANLDVKVSMHPISEQLAMLESGELDLGAMVIDNDAKQLADAVRDRNLQIVDINGAEALARRLPFARAGKIGAGYYDPVRQLPPTEKRVIEVDTLVIGNGCARGSSTQGVITALTRVYPDFVRVSKERPNLTGLPIAEAARSYYEDGGPDPVGQHVPWFIDIMPTARWLQLFFALSMLFAAQAVWHRFRLWRIDARRVEIEGDVSRLFESGVTMGEIAALTPQARHRDPQAREQLDAIIDSLSELGERCRKQSLSILVPMGHEMTYRYQESLIADLMHALRLFRNRLDG